MYGMYLLQLGTVQNWGHYHAAYNKHIPNNNFFYKINVGKTELI